MVPLMGSAVRLRVPGVRWSRTKPFTITSPLNRSFILKLLRNFAVYRLTLSPTAQPLSFIMEVEKYVCELGEQEVMFRECSCNREFLNNTSNQSVLAFA